MLGQKSAFIFGGFLFFSLNNKTSAKLSLKFQTTNTEQWDDKYDEL